MPRSVLLPKLHQPHARAEIVARPRLIHRLDEALHTGLTLISAPAGFGKTTLLSEWVREHTITTAWLSLDKDDNDPIRFVSYITAALQTIQPDIGKSIIEALDSPQPPPTASILSVLINDIFELSSTHLSGRDWVLILDDYHLIEEPPCHEVLVFLLDHIPLQMHLVIATRADPPLPLARMRGRAQLTELRAADLRFSVDEAAEFLRQATGFGLSADDVSALSDRTEGWIAGLQMAAVSMRGREDITEFIQAFTGSNRYILDYLIEEVLERQSEHIRDFLLRTSILERLTGPLCEMVTGCSDAYLMLDYLERANLFITPLDSDRRWYRYHHLFSDVLRARLQREYPAQDVQNLHRRASRWYEQQGQIDDAVKHALKAEDLEHVTGLIGQHAYAMMQSSDMRILLRWIDALPDALVSVSPRLSMIEAWALLASSQFESVEPRLKDIEQILGCSAEQASTDPTLPASLRGALGEILCIRANLAFHHANLPGVLTLSQQAASCLTDDVEAGLFQTRSDLCAVAAFNTALAHEFNGDARLASESFDKAITLARLANNMSLISMSYSHVAHMQHIQGRLHQSAQTYRQMIELAHSSDALPSPLLGMAYVGLGGVLYEWNQLEEAQVCLQEGIDLASPWSNWEILVSGYLYLARIRAARGDWDGVDRGLNELVDKLPALQSPWGLPFVQAHQAWFWIQRGNLEAAASWIRQSDLTVDGVLVYSREPETLIFARVLAAIGRLDDGRRLLDRLLAAMEDGGRSGCAVDVLVGQSLALQALHEQTAALAPLECALTLAEPEGFTRVFLDEGEPMIRLLREAVRHNLRSDYARTLLAAFAHESSLIRATETSREPVATAARSGKDVLIEPLSERELEVLRLVADGLSNQEIGERLVVSLPTVKWHTAHIYGKLEVGNRTQAVAKARALGLLP